MAGLDEDTPHAPSGLTRALRSLLQRLLSAFGRRPEPAPVPVRSPVAATGPTPVVTRPRRATAGMSRPAGVPRAVPVGPVEVAGTLRGTFRPVPGAPGEIDQLPHVFRPRLAPTTHTYEMSQLTVLDERLRRDEMSSMTASDLGLAHKVPGHAVLVALRWDGPPEYPYVHGRFHPGGEAEVLIADLDTATLREISQRLGLRQVWNE